MRKFEDLRWRSIAKTVGNLAALRLRWGEGFMQIARGQRLKLTDIGLDRTPFTIALSLPQGSLSIDLACVGLDATRMLSDERYMSFYNQPATPCGAVKLDGNRIQIDLARLPTDIHALILTLAIDGPGVMSMLGSGKLALLTNGAGEAATCAIEGTSFADERALMLLELYRKDGAWRTCFIGQGFNGGLDALIRHFGGSVDEPSSPSTPPTLLQPLSLPPPLPNPNAAAEIIASQRILALENHIADLGRELEQAKAAAQSWTSASSNLSCDAAEARAKNQGAGHGFLGSVLGSKYRSAVRASAYLPPGVSRTAILRSTRMKNGNPPSTI